ncbi:Glycosyl transferase family 2 [uncultured archaeon]|nr:Glycosyl transferase family 2 [uncultured archaeon]
MKSQIILPSVTLCAIVRDEKINPAGGIEDFLHCTMPFVGAGVIVDTGSIDGTREILEDSKRKYSNLSIYDRKFRGFAQARNYSLSKVQTPWVLVLDADERLSQEDFEKIKNEIASPEKYMTEYRKDIFGFELGLFNIYTNDTERSCDILNPRIFRSDCNFCFSNNHGRRSEYLYENQGLKSLFPTLLGLNRNEVCFRYSGYTEISVKQFRTDENGQTVKEVHWNKILKKHIGRIPSPSKTKGFFYWKKLNPQRLNYHFGPESYEFKVSQEQGVSA